MRLPGPYQHCTPCKTEKAHFWVAELTLECSNCGKQTTVAATALKRREVLARLEKGDFTPGVTMIEGKPKVCTNQVKEPYVIAASKGVVIERDKSGKPLTSARTVLMDFSKDESYPASLEDFKAAEPKPLNEEDKAKLSYGSSGVEYLTAEQINHKYGDFLPEPVQAPVVKKGWADGL